jgi:hypothetical protein
MKIEEGKVLPKMNFVKRNSILLIVLTVTVGIACISATATLWRRNTVSDGPSYSIPNIRVQFDTKTPRTLTLLPIKIGPLGFQPKEVTRPAGNFELLLINATGEKGLELQLLRDRDGEGGPELVQKLQPKPGRNLRKQVHLAPGEYLLTVRDHPEWVCRLIITNP